MVRAAIVVVLVATSAPAAAGGWVAACVDRMEDARLAYQGAVDEMPRWDFAQWDWLSDKRGVRLHYSWRDYDYRLAVTATSEPRHAWRARWVHGEWWFERVEHGRVASVRASGGEGIRNRDALLHAFQPALDACLTK